MGVRQHYLYIYTRDITNTQLVGGLKSIKNTNWDDNNISSLLGMIITDYFFFLKGLTPLSLSHIVYIPIEYLQGCALIFNRFKPSN